jgi:hypothetical protein
VLDTSTLAMTPPAVMDPSAQASVPLLSDKASDRSNLEAMAQLKPNTLTVPSIVQFCKSSVVHRGRSWPEVPSDIGW